MPQYTPFRIPFKQGLVTAQEPWRTPWDAFPVLLDARVERGVLEKRQGLYELADTGAGYPIMGIGTSIQNGHPVHLVCDRKRVYRLDTYGETLTDLVESDVFDGTDKDYFCFDTWNDICYFSQGRQLYYHEESSPEATAALDTTGGDEDNVAIQGALMIFHYKNRLLFVSPCIAGTWYYRRLYYTDINATNVDALNYVTGQFSDMPRTGCYIGEEPFVFCREGAILRIRYTQNTDAPFVFEQLSADHPVIGPFPAPTYRDRALLLTSSHLEQFDRYQMQPVDQAIRYITSQYSLSKSWWMSGTARRDKAIVYLTCAADGSSAPDRLIEWDYEEGNFAIHRIAASCVHATTGQVSPTGDDLAAFLGAEALIPTITEKDPLHHPDYGPMVLIGGLTGKVLLFDYGDDDNGEDIAMKVLSAALNPFVDQDRKVKFGKLKFLVDVDADAEFTVSLYKDLNSTPFKTLVVTCGGSTNQKWVTLYPDGEVGNFFRIGITNDASDNRPRIHEMVLNMAPAGKLDAGGAESEGLSNWRWIENDDGFLELQKKVDGTWTTNVVWDAGESVDPSYAGLSNWRWIENDDGTLELQKKVSGTWTTNAVWDH